MADQKAPNITSIPIDAFSNLRITSIWTFLMSVSKMVFDSKRANCSYESSTGNVMKLGVWLCVLSSCCSGLSSSVCRCSGQSRGLSGCCCSTLCVCVWLWWPVDTTELRSVTSSSWVSECVLQQLTYSLLLLQQGLFLFEYPHSSLMFFLSSVGLVYTAEYLNELAAINWR